MTERNEGFRLPQLGVDELADRIRAAIGAEAWEEVTVMLPQFERVDGSPPWWYPESAESLRAIETAPPEFLRSLGLRVWAREDGVETWLYPSEWYGHIPAGFEIVDICGRREPFVPDVTDDDRRFGCLAYGFTRQTEEPTP